MSQPLRNPRHERFAQLVASGAAFAQAYVTVGYKPNPGNARRLRGLEPVAKRIEALLTESARKTVDFNGKQGRRAAYGRDEAMAELDALIAGATTAGQFGAVASAVALRAKLHNLLIEKKEVGGPGAFDKLSDDQLRSMLLERLSKGAGDVAPALAGADPAPALPAPSVEPDKTVH